MNEEALVKVEYTEFKGEDQDFDNTDNCVNSLSDYLLEKFRICMSMFISRRLIAGKIERDEEGFRIRRHFDMKISLIFHTFEMSHKKVAAKMVSFSKAQEHMRVIKEFWTRRKQG